MTPNWWNDYVGIPYAEKGRDRDGLDCWGLVRLVYQDHFNIALPSLTEDYDAKDYARIEELMATRREGWSKTEVVRSGDLVLMRLFGAETHVGVVTTPGYFLHTREGQDVAIERMDSATWKHRITGIYRYTEGASAISVAACPHPLRSMRVDLEMPSGLNLEQMLAVIRERSGVSDEWAYNGTLALDGEYIPREQWALTVPRPGAMVEYREVARGGVGRAIGMLVMMVAVVAFQQYYLLPALAGMNIVGASAAVISGIAGAGLSMVGSLLMNAIFPVRAPKVRNTPDPGTAIAMNLMQGGTNQFTPYSAIPVVLGKMRFTPPVGAVNYVESVSTDSYLRMLLVWGYGPLIISDLRVGDTKFSTYEGSSSVTVAGYDTIIPSDFSAIYGQDVSQLQPGIKLEHLTAADIAAGTVKLPSEPEGTVHTEAHYVSAEYVLDEDVDRIVVALHFPEGLRQMHVNGSLAGHVDATGFRAKVSVRQLDSVTKAPITGWGDIHSTIPVRGVVLPHAYFNIDSDPELEPVYQWTSVALDAHSNLIYRQGAYTTDSTKAPTGSLLRRLQEANFGASATFGLYPELQLGEEELWRVLVYGSNVVSVVDRRGTGTGAVSGCDIGYAASAIWTTAGTIMRADDITVALGGSGQPYYKRKDAFTHRVSFNVPRGTYEVRVTRHNSSLDDFKYTSKIDGRRYHAAYLQSITGYAYRKPVNQPKPLAMTALSVKATNQINGNIEGITGIAQSVCLDWYGGAWVSRPTSNPASLFRYVLQHPANAQRISDADAASKIDLAGLQSWHSFCKSNNFSFNHIMTEQESVLDVLRDICAAGRASPTIVDGKWTVIVDKPRTQIVQHFTPHNSWGFEGTRAYPKLPHGFRVNFINAAKGFQPDERIVYNDGYSSANASLFEGLTLPGVTNADVVHKLGRFHFAQLKLRPETYTLNADIENLVCSRGDLVRVTHSVPMWGLGSGRIKDSSSTTAITLDDAVIMDAGVTYTIRVRTPSGGSVVRNVVPATTDGYYNDITLTSGLSATERADGNLFMFGSLESESVELIVQSIEPAGNMTARMTLVDYSPEVYSSATEEIPNFDSQITKPPRLNQKVITAKPKISKIVSDESVITRSPSGALEYHAAVVFSTSDASLAQQVTYVQAQMDFAEDVAINWQNSMLVPVEVGVATFSGVMEGDEYQFRLRYVDSEGRTGPWATTTKHTIVGRATPPAAITGVEVRPSGTRLLIDWDDNPELDVNVYEVRKVDSGWGLNDTNRIYFGGSSSCYFVPQAVGVQTFYLRARDSLLKWSSTVTASYTYAAPSQTATISSVFTDTALTTATVTLTWASVTPAFGLAGYTVDVDGVKVATVNATTITLPANWIGSRVFSVKTVDSLGAISAPTNLTVTKSVPGVPTGVRAQVIDNNVQLYWTMPAKTSLPLAHIRMKKGETWVDAEDIGTKSGSFTLLSELSGGNHTYWLAAVDTDGYESTPVSITVTVAPPPDFVFHSSLISDFSGTKSSALWV
jgi:hypothetical protein